MACPALSMRNAPAGLQAAPDAARRYAAKNRHRHARGGLPDCAEVEGGVHMGGVCVEPCGRMQCRVISSASSFDRR
jgi:hypothetical protein